MDDGGSSSEEKSRTKDLPSGNSNRNSVAFDDTLCVMITLKGVYTSEDNASTDEVALVSLCAGRRVPTIHF